MTVSMVVPVYNGKDLLIKYFPTIVGACRCYGIEKTQIILSDDASSDGGADSVKALYPFVTVIYSDINTGFSGAVNRGAAVATGKVLILFNSDIEVSADFIIHVVTHFDKKNIFAVRPAIDGETLSGASPKTGGSFKLGMISVPEPYSGVQAFFAGGGAAAFDRDKFISLGGFDEIFAPFYSEDVDLSYRGRRMGWEIVYEPAATVKHIGGATIKNFYNRRKISVIAERNRYLLVWKNIDDAGYWICHLFWLPVRIVFLALTGDFAPLSGLIKALGLLPELWRKRSGRPDRRCSDKEVFLLFK